MEATLAALAEAKDVEAALAAPTNDGVPVMFEARIRFQTPRTNPVRSQDVFVEVFSSERIGAAAYSRE